MPQGAMKMSVLTKEKFDIGENLKRIKTVFASVDPNKVKLQDAVTLNKVDNAREVLSAIRDKLKEYPKTELRDKNVLRLDKTYNSVMSALDLYQNDEIDKKEFASFFAKAISRLNKISSSIDNLNLEKAKKEEKKKENQGKKGVALAAKSIFDHYDSKDYEDAPPKEDSIMKLLNDAGSAINTYQKYSRQLPATEVESNKMGDFIIHRMPILALTNPLVTSDEYEKAGFITKRIGYYAVVENQLVVGIHSNKIKTTKKIDPKTYLAFLKSKIEREMHTTYQVVGQPTGYKNSGYIYFWLVPERNIDQLRVKAHKPLTVKQWHFAFR